MRCLTELNLSLDEVYRTPVRVLVGLYRVKAEMDTVRMDKVKQIARTAKNKPLLVLSLPGIL